MQSHDQSGRQGRKPNNPASTKDASKAQAGGLSSGKRTRSAKYLKSLLEKEKPKPKKDDGAGEGGRGHRKSKSTTSTYSVFPRPTSQGAQNSRSEDSSDKENQQTPIWAQFATTDLRETSNVTKVPLNDHSRVEKKISKYTPPNESFPKQRLYGANEQPTLGRRPQTKPRPKSECLAGAGAQSSFLETLSGLRHSRKSQDQSPPERQSTFDSTSAVATSKSKEALENTSAVSASTHNKRGSRVMAAVAALNGKSKQRPEDEILPEPSPLDVKNIDSAFESLLVSISTVYM